MKRIKYNFMFVALLLCLGASSQQRTVRLEVAYKAARPMGDFKNLTDKASLNGWEAAVMYGLTDQLSLGLQAGFQDFYQKYGRQVYHGPGGDISAVISNSIQLMPVLLKGKYRFSEEGVVQPFAAIGLGGSLVQYSKYYGQFADSKSGFAFTAQPELGIHIPVGAARRVGINLSAAYNYVPFKGLDADGLSHVSVKAGVTIPMRQ
jgi:outer membrane protein W